jgi:hypothetical protein
LITVVFTVDVHWQTSELTFAELEAFTCTGLSGFLAFHRACIAGEHPVRLENTTIGFGINFAQGAGNSQA